LFRRCGRVAFYLVTAADLPLTRRQAGNLTSLYGMTAVLIVAVLGLAVSLAHF
jgi:hypothetical protein